MTARLRLWLARLGAFWNERELWSVLGVLSASVILVNVNVLSARFYQRWDFTQDQAFTLSEATLATLGALDAPVEIVIFLSRADRLLVDVRQILEEYQAQTRQLEVRTVDPERDPAEFLALQQQYGIVAGKTQEGRLLTDASLVIARGNQRWYITADDLMGLDAEGNVEPRLEQALTEGIAQVTRGAELRICFSTGHQELSVDDVGPHGLAELRLRLEKSNLDVETKDLAQANVSRTALEGCQGLVVAGPEVPFSARAARAVADYLTGGGNVFLLLDPVVDEAGKLGKSGLEPVTAAAGITLGENFVIERDPELRLPNGFGEAFLAEPEPHPVTEGLMRAGSKIDFRVLVVGAQSLGTTQESSAKPVLLSSRRSFALTDLSAVQKGEQRLEPLSDSESGPYVLALAAQLGRQAAGTQSEAASGRLLVSGAVNPAWSRSWRDPTLVGNRLFIENAVAWLMARPALVSIPKRRSFPAGLSLTEESLSDVLLYVLVYMPLTAALMGGFVLVRRRRQTPSKQREQDVDAEGRAS